MLRQVFLSVVFITAHDTKFHVMGQVAGMYFGEEKKETRLRRRLRGRTLPEKAVTPSSVEGGAGFWQRWSLSEQVPVGAGPWRPVRVRGFRMSRHWPLHCRQAGRASRPFGRGRGRNAPSRPAAGRRGGRGRREPACRGAPSTPQAALSEAWGTQLFRTAERWDGHACDGSPGGGRRKRRVVQPLKVSVAKDWSRSCARATYAHFLFLEVNLS